MRMHIAALRPSQAGRPLHQADGEASTAGRNGSNLLCLPVCGSPPQARHEAMAMMPGSSAIATTALAGNSLPSLYPIVSFVDVLSTREQMLVQPWAWLEFYEIETTSSGTLRYVDFQDPNPDAVGTLPTQIAFNGDDYDARKIERTDLKTEEGIAQFTVTIEDLGRELITALDLDDGLNTHKIHMHRIPYDLISTNPALAVTETFRIRSAVARLGPDRVEFSLGLPSLADFEVPNKVLSRNRCWNEYQRRFETDNECRYPSDDFEDGTYQVLGQNDFFAALPTTFPKGPVERKFGWFSVNADLATSWITSYTQAVAGSASKWTRCETDYDDVRIGGAASADSHRRQPLDGAFTQDFLVFVDVTDEMNGPEIVQAFPDVPTTVDAMIFGCRHVFDRLTVNVATAGAGAYAVTWEYFNGTAYSALSGVTDGTSGFKTSGTNTVTYTVPSNWEPSATDGNYYMRARVTTTGFTTIPLLKQAWTDRAHQGMYMWRDITGDFDLQTRVVWFGARTQRMVGIMVQDPDDEANFVFWGNALNASAVEKMRLRQSTDGVITDTDADTTDGDEHIRLTRIGDAITAYARTSETAAWVQKTSKTWTGAPLPLRVGLVVGSESAGPAEVGASFENFLFNAGGLISCDRSFEDCSAHKNLHQFNAFSAIPNQRTRG